MMQYCCIEDLFVQPLRSGRNQLDVLAGVFKKVVASIEFHERSISRIFSEFKLEIITVENPLFVTYNAMRLFLGNWHKGLRALSEHLTHDIIEPLDLFNGNTDKTLMQFETTLKEEVEKSNIYIQGFKNCQETYNKNAEALDLLKSDFKNERVRIDKIESFQIKVADNIESCMSAEQVLTKQLGSLEDAAFNAIDQIKHSEESRLYFTKTIIEKFVFYISGCSSTIIKDSENLNKTLSKLTCEYDTNSICDAFSKLIPEKPVFQIYKTNAKTLENIDFINSTLDSIISEKISFPNDLQKFFTLLQAFEAKETMIKFLSIKHLTPEIGTIAITNLAEIFKRVLASLQLTDKDNWVFSCLLSLSEAFFTKYSNKIKYLYEYLIADNNLNEDSRWMYMINAQILRRIQEENDASKKFPGGKNRKGIFQTFNKIVNTFSRNKNQPVALLERKSAYDVLSTVAFRMHKFLCDPNMTKSVILTFAVNYKLDTDQISELLGFLYQPGDLGRKNEKKIRVIFGHFYLEMALDYLCAKEAVELMMVSKQVARQISFRVYSRLILEIPEKSNEFRSFLWAKILKIHFPSTNYCHLAEEYLKNTEKIAKISGIIDMDIFRSFVNEPRTQEITKKVLKVYAYHNPIVNYCQGMNFMVGLLYKVLQNEELTYNCLHAIIQKFSMSKILSEELIGLKCMFFQLDKLIQYFLPTLYTSLVLINCFSNNFSSSWFLTIFSSSLQEHPEILLKIWDNFLIKGWKFIFRVAIFLLKSYEALLTDRNRKTSLTLLTSDQLLDPDLLTNDLISSSLLIKITTRMLNSLESDYNSILNESNYDFN